MRTKLPTYRELYLRTHALYAQEEGKYQRLLHLTRKISGAVPVGHEVLNDWNDYKQQIDESEKENQ